MAKSAVKKAVKKKTAKTTFVTFVLDRSGSMSTIHDDVVGGYNQYVATLRESENPIVFNLVQFDNQSIDKLVIGADIKTVKDMQPHEFVPRGSTPLIDAIYASIKATEEQVGKKKANVAVTIFTDGYENASKEHTKAELKALVEEKEAQGWVFQYLGSEIDAYCDASSYGIKSSHTMSNASGMAGQSMAAAAMNVNSYAATGLSQSAAFSDSQKLGVGDKYVKSSVNKQSPMYNKNEGVKDDSPLSFNSE